MSSEEKEGGEDDRKYYSERDPVPVLMSDPYAVLKVERDADNDTIQRSYKLLSRNFHPDKQPPGPARDAAQEVFVSFKNAHDILTDPVLRQAFDDHGSRVVEVIKGSMNLREQDQNALYSTLLKLHQSGQQEEARRLVKEAMQYWEFEAHCSKVQFSAAMEFPCSTVATEFLDEGVEPLTVPELQGAHMSFSLTSSRPTPDNKWSVTMGGTTNVVNGKGEASGQLALGYKPVQGTDVNVAVDVTSDPRLAVGSTRRFTSGTMVTTEMSTMPKTSHLGFLFLSQRRLFNKYWGTCSLKVGTDLSLHMYQISCMTLWSDWPQLKAQMRLGASHPFKISARQSFGNVGHGHTGHLSCSFSDLSNVILKGVVDHTVSSYATLSIGIQHASMSGLTWLFGVRRGNVSFRVPVHVSAIRSPGYSYKGLFVVFLSGLFHYAIREELNDMPMSQREENVKEKTRKQDEAAWMEVDKSKRDAEQQTTLMLSTAESSKETEQVQNGLIILQATYWVEGGASMDATIQLQFWVKNSCLKLPPTPKSHLLGFYSLVAAMEDAKRKRSWWQTFLPQQKVQLERQVPKLTVRYSSSGSVYEITVDDAEELVLPHPDAMIIGDSGVVR